MSAHDKVHVRGQGRRTHRGGTDPLVCQLRVTDPSISNLGETRDCSDPCGILRPPDGDDRGHFTAFRPILIDRAYRLELPLSYCKQATSEFLIVAESRISLERCSHVTGPNVAARTGADLLCVRVKYDLSGRTGDRADQVLAIGVGEVKIHDQMGSPKGCGS
jgi:hypothetical protein